MTHGSLFSGIGGFDLAADWMGWDNIFHCEWNPFGQKVLKHHFPNSISYNDITKTDFSIHAGQIDILTGGFPCQPYSSAGKRLGKADERHLFPEMLRAIKEIKPRYIVGENVRGLVSWGGEWYSTKCAMIWKGKDMKFNRFLFLLQVSAHRTKDKEFGLLLTPTTKEDLVNLVKFKKRMEKYPNGTTMPNLATQVMQLLPTPMASEGEKLTGSPSENQMSLTKLARNGMLPTPSALDWISPRKPETFILAQERHKQKGVSLQNPLKQMAVMGMLPTPNQRDYLGCTRPGLRITSTGKTQKYGEVLPDTIKRITSSTSQLNPLFVEEMMGFPENWTLSPFLNGEENQLKDTEMQ